MMLTWHVTYSMRSLIAMTPGQSHEYGYAANSGK